MRIITFIIISLANGVSAVTTSCLTAVMLGSIQTGLESCLVIMLKLKTSINDNVIYDRAMSGIAKAFGSEHTPSKDHWEGIRQIVKVIEGMALQVHKSPETPTRYKEWKPVYYISSLPCGMGKTTALIETVKAIINLPKDIECHGEGFEHKEISFIIFLSKLDEIASLVERMGLDENDYSVLVNDKAEVYKRGNQNKKAARVMFTTQQMLEKLVTEDKRNPKPFSEISDYFYESKPRQVRVWDEAMLPSRVLTLELDRLYLLPIELGKIDNNLRIEVLKFCAELGGAKDGSLIQMPDLSPFTGIVLDQEQSPETSSVLETLFLLSGMMARVSIDNFKKTTTLQYADVMPDDIKPLLILDANGDQSATYKWWKEWRGDLEPLYSPQKSFKGYTVRHWNKGSGKNTIFKKRKDYVDIVDGVSATINNMIPPDEKVLVIHLKPDRSTINLEDAIRPLLDKPGRVKFLTWGRHTATNEFRDYKYVILTSLWFYAQATYDILVSASKKQDIEIPATSEERKLAILSEHRSNILQAACRGKVRQADNGGCPEGCHLYVIYSTQQGLPGQELLESIFPDCDYEPWSPIWRLKGVKAKIADTIDKFNGNFVSLRGLSQKHKQQRYRLLEMMDKEIVPYFQFSKGVLLRFQNLNGREGWVITEDIPRPF